MHSQASLVAVGLDHEFKRVAQVPPALVQGSSLGNGARNLLDPAHKPPVGFRPYDGVVALSHARILSIWVEEVKNSLSFSLSDEIASRLLPMRSRDKIGGLDLARFEVRQHLRYAGQTFSRA